MAHLGISAIWADAVFVSGLQRSDELSAAQVRQAVGAAIAWAWIIPSSISLSHLPQIGLAHSTKCLVSLTPVQRAAADEWLATR